METLPTTTIQWKQKELMLIKGIDTSYIRVCKKDDDIKRIMEYKLLKHIHEELTELLLGILKEHTNLNKYIIEKKLVYETNDGLMKPFVDVIVVRDALLSFLKQNKEIRIFDDVSDLTPLVEGSKTYTPYLSQKNRKLVFKNNKTQTGRPLTVTLSKSQLIPSIHYKKVRETQDYVLYIKVEEKFWVSKYPIKVKKIFYKLYKKTYIKTERKELKQRLIKLLEEALSNTGEDISLDRYIEDLKNRMLLEARCGILEDNLKL